MAAEIEIPGVILRAISLLNKTDGVEITAPPSPSDDKEPPGFAFVCQVPAPSDNSEGIPDLVELRVLVPNSFPYTPIHIYPTNEEVRGFPHQDAQSGKLCLPPEHEAPWNESRLLQYIVWAKEWIADAANGTLLPPGDPYELPDFSCKGVDLPTSRLLIIDESSDSYNNWATRIETHGTATFAKAAQSLVFFPLSFRDDQGQPICSYSISKDEIEKDSSFDGGWILLPDLHYYRQRPPQTFGELAELCKASGLDLRYIIHQVWKQERKEDRGKNELGVILVGCPIPEIVDRSPIEVYWRPLLFRNYSAFHRRFKAENKRGRIKPLGAWNEVLQSDAFSKNAPIAWGNCENVSRRRLYARGSFPAIRETHVSVAGCGAIGSVVAELLARGGASRIELFDADPFQFGNQCRHMLDGRDVLHDKAPRLARRLSSANLLSRIKGHPLHLPPNDPQELVMAIDLLEQSDLIIDCTTDQGAFLWLDKVARGSMTRLASMFIDFNATVLTLCISGKNASCGRVAEKLYAAIQQEKTPIAWDYYSRVPAKEEQVMPGAGCWHPTFPAVNSHIWMLVTSAVDVMQEILSQPLTCDGTAVLLQRRDASSDKVGPLVEVVWRERYR